MELKEEDKFDIIISHVATWDGKEVSKTETPNSIIHFSPYIKNYSDNYTSKWDSKYTMGRMDPISTFQRTQRVITLEFIVPSSDMTEAIENYRKSKKLSDFLYPVYKVIKTSKTQSPVPNELTNSSLQPTTQNLYKATKLANTLEEQLNLRDGVATMSAPPIVKIQFSNLVQNRAGDDGLYGYLEAFNFKPESNMGFFIGKDEGTIIPKVYNVNLTFNVIHTEALGWDINNNKRTGGDFY